ncbi:Fc receptor-like A [Rana temporaria]|uniref:Fc receptor-like A n=1 Tax=Rana temporaria TaxID=8407 RepID=UPI001AACE5B4|nr:Fc receptor-like A [Rana temporaria]
MALYNLFVCYQKVTQNPQISYLKYIEDIIEALIYQQDPIPGSIRSDCWLNSNVKKRSDELNIKINELFTAPEIKVKTNRVLEGDHMTLTCDTSLSPHSQTDLQFAFYRDQRTVQNSTLSDQYGVEMAQLKDSGKYYCEAKTLNSNVKKRSDELNIKINELFTAPEIKVKTNGVLEEDHMTPTCDTSLSPHTQTDLQFAFYRDQRTVQNSTLSDQYGVEMAQLKDSGKYYCEAKTLNSNVKKRSDQLNVKINGRCLVLC